MLVATLRFPLGVYYALGAATAAERRQPEWPPNPVRLIGGLLDAAHGQSGGADLEVLAAISAVACAAPPQIHAPVAQSEPASQEEIAVIAGPSRWAPRNASLTELKGGLSLRDLAGPRSAVDKGGVVIGDQPVRFAWDGVTLSSEELRHLKVAAADIAWFGTSRSPVIVEFTDAFPEEASSEHRWDPVPAGAGERVDVQVRVPSSRTLALFDAEYDRRRSTKDKIESSGLQKPASAGETVGYVRRGGAAGVVHDPRHWGAAYVLEVSTESAERPNAPAAYLVARAVRAALLAQYGDAGTPNEAPAVLRGRGSVPHAAFVPLPFVGADHADGSIKGVAILLPHPERLAGDLTDADSVEQGIANLLDAGGGRVRLLGSGELELRETVPVTRPLASLDLQRYAGPSRTWETVTPVVHSHWRAAKSRQALIDQVAADCAHVDLPAPARVEVLRQAALRGAPPATVDCRGLRGEWQGPINGPSQHLRIEFEVPVRGPVLLGRARHFGLGLLRPVAEDDR